jgi:hypothetical protein
MGRVNGHTAEQVIDAVKQSHGIVANAARVLGIGRNTVYAYMKNYPTIAKAVQDERDEWIDLAEQEMLKKIMRGDTQMIMFFLKTVGKSRGYVETIEHKDADRDAKGYTILANPDMWDK